MYRDPKNVDVFDKYYFEKHIPIAKRIPGLRKYEVSQGRVVTPAGSSGFHLIATLHFNDLAAIQRAFASAEGQAAAADVQTFATGGVDPAEYEADLSSGFLYRAKRSQHRSELNHIRCRQRDLR
jgi:uncharacterized protein (TIGR02118 family)